MGGKKNSFHPCWGTGVLLVRHGGFCLASAVAQHVTYPSHEPQSGAPVMPLNQQPHMRHRHQGSRVHLGPALTKAARQPAVALPGARAQYRLLAPHVPPQPLLKAPQPRP